MMPIAINLKARIYSGFAIKSVLLCGIGLIGFLGTSELYQSSNEMQHVSDINASVLGIDRDIQELQLHVGRYMASSQDAIRQEIVELNDRLFENISAMASQQTDPELREIFDKMAEHLPEYRNHFDSVVAERQIRVDLVHQQLPRQSAVIAARMAEIRQQLRSEDHDADIQLRLLRCESEFSQAEKLLLRYYVASDSAYLNQALTHMESAVAAIESEQLHPSTAQLRRSLAADLQEYERIGLRAVQATRGYLFLVNVLMAGEASEISYYSGRLRDLASQRRDEISAQVSQTARRVRQMTGLGIASAVAIAMLIAGRLAFAVLQPVSQMTSTFSQLAAGETMSAIPGTDRHDEIGDMARAAAVFSEQNQKQRDLLGRTEQLAEELTEKAGQLAATNAELDSFAYVASHDLKSPLRGIRQLSSWIEEDSGHLLPPESLRHFRTIQSRITKMELLLNDLLSFSRIGRANTEPEPVCLTSLLKNILDFTDNPDHVAVHFPRQLPVVHTVRIPLEQVLLNLIGNAIK
ncbi:MAG: hypothetical protein KDA85_04525, partial [Planctomycetaceae bacterium]|nr:hypothetical protein [Planctomycetaceae bacterium]